MNEHVENRWPTGLKWLLVYQFILVVISVYFILTYVTLFIAYKETAFMLYVAIIACAALAISIASVGMMRRSHRAVVLGMICHLLIAVLSVVGLIGFFLVGLLASSQGGHEGKAMFPMFLMFALMWSPFILISGWAFRYLRDLPE